MTWIKTSERLTAEKAARLLRQTEYPENVRQNWITLGLAHATLAQVSKGKFTPKMMSKRHGKIRSMFYGNLIVVEGKNMYRSYVFYPSLIRCCQLIVRWQQVMSLRNEKPPVAE